MKARVCPWYWPNPTMPPRSATPVAACNSQPVPPKDLALSLSAFGSDVDTNYPKPVEAGQWVVFGATVFNRNPYTATGITVTHTFTGPVEIDPARTWGVQS